MHFSNNLLIVFIKLSFDKYLDILGYISSGLMILLTSNLDNNSFVFSTYFVLILKTTHPSFYSQCQLWLGLSLESTNVLQWCMMEALENLLQFYSSNKFLDKS